MARSKKLGNTNSVKHGLYRAHSALIKDGRTREARFYFSVYENLIAELGGEETVSFQQKLLAGEAAFKSVQCAKAKATIIAGNGTVAESLKEAYRRFSRELREDLKTLGLARVPRKVNGPDLSEFE